MTLPRIRFRTIAAPVVAVSLLLGAAALGVPGSFGAPEAAAETRYEVTVSETKVAMRDGVNLLTTVVVPAGDAPEGGWPLIVMPGTWAGQSIEFGVIAEGLASHGYVVLNYIQRGFNGSDGLVGGGGPDEVADVSQVIDHGLATYDVNADKVGLAALSYGAGVSLIASAKDPRVKAVVALSGWADLGWTFFPNDTRTPYANQWLQAILELQGEGQASPELDQAFTNTINGVEREWTLDYAAQRSVVTYMDELNANGPAIFIGEPMNETTFPIDQMTRFWESYTAGPKHLDLRPGDHAGPETYTGTLEVVSASWEESFRWLDTYVGGYVPAGDEDSIAQEPAVRVQPRSPGPGFHDPEWYDGIEPTDYRRYFLSTGVDSFDSRHLTNDEPQFFGAGETRIEDGLNIYARPFWPLYSYWGELATGFPGGFQTPFVDKRVTRIWQSSPLFEDFAYRGEARVKLDLTPSAANGTVVVYTLDIDPTGYNANMITRQPYTFENVTPGEELTAEFELPYNAFDIPFGHRLGIYVSTSDVTYADENQPGDTIDIASSSYVDFPMNSGAMTAEEAGVPEEYVGEVGLGGVAAPLGGLTADQLTGAGDADEAQEAMPFLRQSVPFAVPEGEAAAGQPDGAEELPGTVVTDDSQPVAPLPGIDPDAVPDSPPVSDTATVSGGSPAAAPGADSGTPATGDQAVDAADIVKSLASGDSNQQLTEEITDEITDEITREDGPAATSNRRASFIPPTPDEPTIIRGDGVRRDDSLLHRLRRFLLSWRDR